MEDRFDAFEILSNGYSDVVDGPLPGHSQIMSFRAYSNELSDKVAIRATDNLGLSSLEATWSILQTLQNAAIAGIPRSLKFEVFDKASAIIFADDSDWVSLRSYHVEHSDINYKVLLAQLKSICHTLARVHVLGIRHRNLTPDTIFIDSLAPETTIIHNWDLATFAHESSPISNDLDPELALEYLAPECTGRLPHFPVDHRADIYAIGIMVFELVTGTLPFTGENALELIHGHVARRAPDPLSLAPSMTRPMAELIKMCLHKSPAKRYQTFEALEADFDDILSLVCSASASKQASSYPFEVGRVDRLSRWIVSEKFVGREKEYEVLSKLFDELLSFHRSKIAIIKGSSGVGKSRLVSEVFKAVPPGRIYFSLCKFSQFVPFTPFAIVKQLANDLLLGTFTKDTDSVALIRDRISNRLGDDAKVLVEMVPGLTSLLGQAYFDALPPSFQLTATSIEDRCKRAFQTLFEAFADGEKPVVIFLDDLQWASPTDLEILLKLSQNALRNCFMLCAYRDNEVDKAHVVQTDFLDGLAVDATIFLSSLSSIAISDILATAMGRPLVDGVYEISPDFKELCDYVSITTQNDVFFATQLLQFFYQSNLVKFDFVACRWKWDMNSIRSIAVSEDVFNLLLNHLKTLDEDCVHLLEVASCLGTISFDVETLTIALDCGMSAVEKGLRNAIDAGLVLVVGGETEERATTPEPNNISASEMGLNYRGSVRYRFVHDRIQQACYDLISETERPQIHLQIGLRLLSELGQSGNVFDLCDQINQGRGLVEDLDLKFTLAKLNMSAAQSSLQVDATLHYLMVAGQLFSKDIWIQHAEVATEYHFALLEAHISLKNHNAALVAVEALLEHVADPSMRVQILERKARSLWSIPDPVGIMDVARISVALVEPEIDFVGEPESRKLQNRQVLKRLQSLLPDDAQSIRDYRNLGQMTNKLYLAVQQLLVTIMPAFFFTDPEMVPLLTMLSVTLTFQHGNSVAGCYMCAFHSLSICIGQHEKTSKHIQALKTLTPAMHGTQYRALFEMLTSVIIYMNEDFSDDNETFLASSFKHAEIWAAQCALHFQGWLHFLIAEQRRREEDVFGALESYNIAIEYGQTANHFLLLGLINERVARWLPSTKVGESAARGYARSAHNAFDSWGCRLKAKTIVQQFPHAFSKLEIDQAVRIWKTSSREFKSTDSSGRGTSSTSRLSSVDTLISGDKPRFIRTTSTPRSATVETDLAAVIRVSLILSQETNVCNVVRELLVHLIQLAGAAYGALITSIDGQLYLRATAEGKDVMFHSDVPLDRADQRIPRDLINLVAYLKKPIADEAKYFRHKPIGYGYDLPTGSFIALPILHQNELIAVAYMHNGSIPNLFDNHENYDLLTVLIAQAGSLIERGKLFDTLRLANEALQTSKDQIKAHNLALQQEIEVRVKVEQELKSAKEAAEAATRQKSRFLAMMSHEIRTPFNSVIGFANLLLDSQLDGLQKQMIQAILGSSNNLLNIINDILDFSKIEKDKLTLFSVAFDLRTCVESCLEAVLPAASKKQLELVYLENEPRWSGTVHADNLRLRQCLLNLLSNAVKFTEKGEIIVTSAMDLIDDVSGQSMQDAVLTIRVKDTGIGIALTEQDRLFKDFSQVDDSITRQFGGTGLGLAITQKICSLFSGELTVDSAKGAGSTFTATFHIKVDQQGSEDKLNLLEKKTCILTEPSVLQREVFRCHLDAFGVTCLTEDSELCQPDFVIYGGDLGQLEYLRNGFESNGVTLPKMPALIAAIPFGVMLTKEQTARVDAIISKPAERKRLYDAICMSLDLLNPSGSLSPAQGEPSGTAKSTRPIEIMVVEDNLINVQIAKQYLKREGHDVTIAYDGIQGVEKSSTCQFDLIFMDINMPHLDGVGATQQIRQRGGKQPYICAMTANAMVGDRAYFLQAGCDDYISKPITRESLQRVLNAVAVR